MISFRRVFMRTRPEIFAHLALILAFSVFACFYRTPEALLKYFQEAGIRVVVSDTLPPINSFEFQRVLTDTIAKYPGQLKLIASFKSDTSGKVSVYRVN